MPGHKAARNYAAAKAAHARAVARLQEAHAALDAVLIGRRNNGESNKDIAADLGLTAQFVTVSLGKNAEYQAALDAKRRAMRAAEDERHRVWMECRRTIIQKADAGIDVSALSAQSGLSPRRVQRIIEQDRWVLSA